MEECPAILVRAGKGTSGAGPGLAQLQSVLLAQVCHLSQPPSDLTTTTEVPPGPRELRPESTLVFVSFRISANHRVKSARRGDSSKIVPGLEKIVC